MLEKNNLKKKQAENNFTITSNSNKLLKKQATKMELNYNLKNNYINLGIDSHFEKPRYDSVFN